MEHPEIAVSPDRTLPQSARSMRWVRWVAAALVLIILAMAFHTTGKTAQSVQRSVRHWIASNWHIPHALTRSAADMLGGLTTPTRTPGTTAAWRAPIAGAVLTQPYGWQGSGVKAKFVPNILVKAKAGTPVMAGVRGRITGSGPSWVIIQTQGYRLRFANLSSPVLARGSVMPGTAIGRTGSTPLTLTVTKDGYPINPLGSVLFGSHWIRR